MSDEVFADVDDVEIARRQIPGLGPNADVTDFPIVQVASECDLYGHPYEVLDFVGAKAHAPESVLCLRCGLSWKVER